MKLGKLRSLNSISWVRKSIIRTKWHIYTKFWGMDIARSASFSMKTHFDKTYPKGVHIGERSYVAFDVAILAHDMTRGLYLHTRIGDDCFIGARSIILPGITIGSGSIVGSGSVVTKDVPPHSIVAGNPAKVIRSDIEVGPFGRFTNAEETKMRLVASGAFD
ncbi:acyltransferase [Aureimonas phyllosphaerae]|uniref:Acetyltransferase-like isoleucine patch superfamily enzyme n=1 Tax=Aureimonas phyllosphaerae TaxID=1166078 RepID=A0A7W6FWB5_9HYPH|nr:DapH/DapD/GlmU-related protein [Aureimonas phyllosphaerae]MBB3938026.1 acetyltransferase-like isoleucine patch superfamily enzyme [Aureimonas phyllosphaerae]MBB3962033.1 acetyltransferase-like isoleucine patch superfamily enzyme [Aureimonas phyllosphaerae]SFF54064.1 Hexapeptide repeat of succinyl-transferase [Aureimonas phyllosphaerae]